MRTRSSPIYLISDACQMPKHRREGPTIQDVADRAGVSTATVSRVLNDSGYASEATRERVQAAIDHLQYRPDRTAKALAEGSTPTIAVAVPTFTTPFHNELLKGVRSRLDDVNADLLLCDLKWEDPVSSLRTFLARGAMDGLLATGLPGETAIRDELDTLGRPVVLVGSKWEEFDSFSWDETVGARRATEHLLNRGHTQIGMITTDQPSPIRNARIRGYQTALEDAGLEPRPERIVTGHTKKHAGFSEEAGYEAMLRFLQRDAELTAIFASSDVQAIGAWQALREQGRSVPEDVALVGYDDLKISRFMGLSSVAQNMHDIGEAATDLLLRRLQREGKATPVSHLVTPELVIRDSSDHRRQAVAS